MIEGVELVPRNRLSSGFTQLPGSIIEKSSPLQCYRMSTLFDIYYKNIEKYRKDEP